MVKTQIVLLVKIAKSRKDLEGMGIYLNEVRGLRMDALSVYTLNFLSSEFFLHSIAALSTL